MKALFDRLALHVAIFKKVAEKNMASHYEEVQKRGKEAFELAADMSEAMRHLLKTEEDDRAFRRRLNDARAYFGTATTQTQIPKEHRQASIEAVRKFFDSLDPAETTSLRGEK